MPKTVLKILGRDGNAFAILGAAQAAAKKAGWTPDEIKAVLDDAMSGDYDHLLVVMSENFDVR